MKPLPGQGYLFEDLVETWEGCLQVAKSTCSVKNIRLHYSDVRFANPRKLALLQTMLTGLTQIADILKDLQNEVMSKERAQKFRSQLRQMSIPLSILTEGTNFFPRYVSFLFMVKKMAT